MCVLIVCLFLLCVLFGVCARVAFVVYVSFCCSKCYVLLLVCLLFVVVCLCSVCVLNVCVCLLLCVFVCLFL